MEVVISSESWRAHCADTGYVTISEVYLKFGVQFPLNSFFVDVLNFFSLTVFQIMPIGWAHMIKLYGLLAECNMGPPIATKFTWFYSLKSNKNDLEFYYFDKRAVKEL